MAIKFKTKRPIFHVSHCSLPCIIEYGRGVYLVNFHPKDSHRVVMMKIHDLTGGSNCIDEHSAVIILPLTSLNGFPYHVGPIQLENDGIEDC